MPRPSLYTREAIVAATSKLVAEAGPAATSVAKIAAALGAPSGSIYHRFRSRDMLLGEVWLTTTASFQNSVVRRLANPDAELAGLQAALFVPQWVRDYPEQARILVRHRREDFLDGSWPADMTAQAKTLQTQFSTQHRKFCQRLLGRVDANALRITAFALAQAPLAAVRGYVEANQAPPRIVDELIEHTYRATVALGKRSS